MEKQDEIRNEQMELKNERNEIRNERNEIKHERRKIAEERDELEKERERMKQDRERMKKERDIINSEYDQLDELRMEILESENKRNDGLFSNYCGKIEQINAKNNELKFKMPERKMLITYLGLIHLFQEKIGELQE